MFGEPELARSAWVVAGVSEDAWISRSLTLWLGPRADSAFFFLKPASHHLRFEWCDPESETANGRGSIASAPRDPRA